MPKPTLEELVERLKKSNDDYHEVVDEILVSEHVSVAHKALIGSKAHKIFTLMTDMMIFLVNLSKEG